MISISWNPNKGYKVKYPGFDPKHILLSKMKIAQLQNELGVIL